MDVLDAATAFTRIEQRFRLAFFSTTYSAVIDIVKAIIAGSGIRIVLRVVHQIGWGRSVYQGLRFRRVVHGGCIWSGENRTLESACKTLNVIKAKPCFQGWCTTISRQFRCMTELIVGCWALASRFTDGRSQIGRASLAVEMVVSKGVEYVSRISLCSDLK